MTPERIEELVGYAMEGVIDPDLHEGDRKAIREALRQCAIEAYEEAEKACRNSIQAQGPYFATLIRSLKGKLK